MSPTFIVLRARGSEPRTEGAENARCLACTPAVPSTRRIPHVTASEPELRNFAVQVCDVNFTQIGGNTNDTKAECVKCPVENDFCYANKFKMKPGHMVDPEDISFTFYCPNPSACPGGNSSNLSLMCADGYEGKSCANCSMGYAISDSSVLLCTRCPTKSWQQALQWLYMLAKHVLPFALAANSALPGSGAEVARLVSSTSRSVKIGPMEVLRGVQ